MGLFSISDSFLIGVMVTKCCLGKINMILVQMMDYKGQKPGNEAILVMYSSDNPYISV